MNTFQEIISKDNLSLAYFNVVKKFDELSKSNKYSGFDGLSLNRYDLFSGGLLEEIKKDILQNKTIEPALKISIPKKSKEGQRDVYLHILKERIKAQAVYQSVEPVFDKYFSNYLFSYRTTHPHYQAIRTIIKRYKKTFKESYVLVGDVSSYSDNIDVGILIKKIKELKFDEETQKILEKYIKIKYLEGGLVLEKDSGFVTGLPITILFNNLYLDSMDKEIGLQASLYRRVGDDFIIFDSYERLIVIKDRIETIFDDLKITKDKQKITIIKTSEEFKFLGYKLKNGIISIPNFSLNKIKTRFRKRLKFYPFSKNIKIKNLKNILYGNNPLISEIIEILNQYNQVDDREQMKKLSDYFFIRLTVYFFKSYTPANHRKTIKLTKNLNIPSLFSYYIYFHTGKYSLGQLRLKHSIIKKHAEF